MKAGESLWAIGDCCGIWPLTYVGKYQGRIAAANILGHERHADYAAVPRVVFTDPQAAAVGEADGERTVTVQMSSVARTATFMREYDRPGYMTLLSDGERITGAHAVGPEAGEWLQQATLAIRAQVPLDVMADVIQPLPHLLRGLSPRPHGAQPANGGSVKGVRRLGSPLVNWYLVEDGDRLTAVDAGPARLHRGPRGRPRLIDSRPSDVEAVILTHSDADHTGLAEKLREAGARVLIHADDDETLRKPGPKTGDASPSHMLGQLHKPPSGASSWESRAGRRQADRHRRRGALRGRRRCWMCRATRV